MVRFLIIVSAIIIIVIVVMQVAIKSMKKIASVFSPDNIFNQGKKQSNQKKNTDEVLYKKENIIVMKGEAGKKEE